MTTYCLDANFFIEGWNKYYSPEFCKSYWDIISELGKKGQVFVPQMVKDEIDKVDDTLKDWLNRNKFMIKPIDDEVQQSLKRIYSTNPIHANLVDNTKNRSVADPWVIAHALAIGAVVVTKETLMSSPNSSKIRIPNVCQNMGVRYIDDFEFIKEIKINFDCKL